MSQAVHQAETNHEAALLAIAERNETERAVLLWQKPTLADFEIPEAVGIPHTLWAAIKAEGDGPPLFLIGRRLFVRTEDLRSWLNERAKGARPGSKRHREKRESEAA